MKKKIVGFLIILATACVVAAFAAGCGHTHEFGEWTVTTAATCTTDGARARTCTGCNETETEAIAAIGHKFATAWTTDGTDHWHICENGCTELGDKAAHSYNKDTPDNPADDFDCTICGVYIATEGLSFQGYKTDDTTTGEEAEIAYYAVSSTGEATDTHIRIPLTYKDKPVMTVGADAFKNNTNITAITMKDNIATIGANAFTKCSELKTVVFGKSLTTVETEAFNDCSKIESVYYGGDIASWCGIFFRAIKSNPLRYAEKLIIDGTWVKEVEIPASVATVKSFAFSFYKSLEKVTIKNGVESIAAYAFSTCTNLNSVVIESGALAQYVFNGCTALTDVTIGSGVHSISRFAFYGCSALANAKFDNITGWTVASSLTAVDSAWTTVAISSSDLTANATLLKSTNRNKFWKWTEPATE